MKKKISVIMAHPDDAEIICSGTIFKYLARGFEVIINIVCSGNMGISVIDRDNQLVSGIDESIRANETKLAFSRYEHIKINFLGFRDGEINQDINLTSKIERVLLDDKPNIVITHFNDISGNDHQDHAVVSKTTTNALNRIKNVEKILYAEPILSYKMDFQPNYFEDITIHFDEKIECLRFHNSQSGRFYLTKDFHLTRGRMNALKVHSSKFMKCDLYESFISITLDSCKHD